MHTHPTPMHIHVAILDAISAAEKQHGQSLPIWLGQAIRDGIRNACAEHDAECAKRKAA